LALQTLKMEGLVEGRPNRGYRIKSLSIREVRNANIVRAALEATAARTITEMGVADAIRTELEQNIGLMDDVLKRGKLKARDFEECRNLNQEFHWIIVEGSENETLVRTLEALAPMLLIASKLISAFARDIVMSELRTAHAEHMAIFGAIVRDDVATAEFLMRAHSMKAIYRIQTACQKLEIDPTTSDAPFDVLTSGGEAIAAE